MKKINGFLILLFGILLGGSIMRFGPTVIDKINQYPVILNDNTSYYQDKYRRFEEVNKILKEGYYDYENVDEKHMIQKALKAYVDGIDDPYTVYMDADQNSGFIGSLEGEENFEGIGALVTKKDYYVQVEEVLKGSPAFKAGIKPLDRIIKINSGYVEEESLDEAVARMRGPAGTKVNIVIERFNLESNNTNNTGSSISPQEELKGREIIEVEVTRDKINLPSVVSEVIDIKTNTGALKKIGYIEIFIIGEETEKLFKKEVKKLKSAGIEGVILDLRGNGGGLMPIAVEIASHFVKKGELIVSTKYKGYEDENYYSKGFGEFENMDTVVLIDGMTASAGEIIAIALQEQAGAKLLGTKSFGKGTIQTLDEFEDGDSIKYTIGKRFPPSKRNIDKIGITPDIIVEFDANEYINNGFDNQLEAAKEIFKF